MQTTGNKITNICKNVEIVKVHDHIWNHHEKCIQLSTNMPGIGSVIREIAGKMSEISTILDSFCSEKNNTRVVSVNAIGNNCAQYTTFPPISN